jgi:cation diffusion facilitator CzcD-associated flavoprotein CzcO
VAFIVLEQGSAVASRWRQHYERLHLHTDKDHSALPGRRFPAGTARYPSRRDVIAYLEAYTREQGIEPRLGERAESIRRHADGWLTTTAAGSYRSQAVIVATGHNSVPNTPRWPGQERFRGRILHSSEYGSGEPFRSSRVLTVGFGNSGGDIAADLHGHGARVAVSVRGPVHVVPRDILGIPVLSVSRLLDRLPSGIADMLAAPLIRLTLGDLSQLGLRRPVSGPITQIRRTGRIPLLDTGTVGLIRKGRIELMPGVQAMDETHVTFTDGRRKPFDAIVLATGFRPGLEQLLVAADLPAELHGNPAGAKAGLFFCGFVVTPRGTFSDIGAEARRIAAEVARSRGTLSSSTA